MWRGSVLYGAAWYGMAPRLTVRYRAIGYGAIPPKPQANHHSANPLIPTAYRSINGYNEFPNFRHQ